MCGIIGSVNQELTYKQVMGLQHRGPDFQDMIHKHINNNEVYLGHTRLAIVDTSISGNQPMISEEGNILIFNGEVYNHKNLRSDLEGINFSGHSDSETILKYLSINEMESSKDFNGIFSFAFINVNENKLYLCRDRFGVKPLYYFKSENSLVFGSEIHALKHILNPKMDNTSIREILKIRYCISPNTIYQGINKVRPGHYLEVNLDSKKIQCLEKPYIRPNPTFVDFTFSKAIQNYGKIFEESIKRQLMSDVEVGILLSGGIDSALVAYFANKHSGDTKLKAFTVGFTENDTSDEIDAAAETAKLLNLDHKCTKISYDYFIDSLSNIANIVEEPVGTTSIAPMMALCELASKHVKVVLSGQGADEPLGGYVRYQGELLYSTIPNGMLPFFKLVRKIFNIKNERFLRGINSFSESDFIQRFIESYSLFSDAEINNLMSSNCQHNITQKMNYFRQLLLIDKYNTDVEKMMGFDLKMNLSDDLLMYTDKISMNYSLEVRVPMLDNDLINYIESLPLKYKITLRKRKVIHKEFAREVLPSSIINRKKMGFQSPTRIWFRDHSEDIRNIFMNFSHKFKETFRMEYVDKLIDHHLYGFNKEKQIFLLLFIGFLTEE